MLAYYAEGRHRWRRTGAYGRWLNALLPARDPVSSACVNQGFAGVNTVLKSL